MFLKSPWHWSVPREHHNLQKKKESLVFLEGLLEALMCLDRYDITPYEDMGVEVEGMDIVSDGPYLDRDEVLFLFQKKIKDQQTEHATPQGETE